MYCIGVDVSKQQLVTYDGERRRTFPNTSELKELAAFLEERGEQTTVVFEPTSTYSRALESFCRSRKLRCWRLNPRVLPHLREVSQGRSKTDRTDAELLWQYGQDHGPGQPLEEDHLGHTLRVYLSCYAQAQKARIACQQLREALSHDPNTPAEVLEGLGREIDRLKLREERMLAQAQACIEEDEEVGEGYALLLTIPGVGRVTALVLVALFRRYPEANRGEIVAVVGMDPTEHRSGSSIHRKARISKRGDGFVRKTLYEATLAAVRFNPGVRGIYRRLKEKGKPEKVARMAAARKLLLIAHAVYRSGQPYRAPAHVGG
ncbi:IS110 family transposase [Candidatus Bipolaricaulota bacterium]|nr:IS110 family transposase [Candidatus Bipolaricaulota bacterium]